MVPDLCEASIAAGFSLLWLGLLVHAILHAYVMTLGDLYLMFRRVRARAFRHFRTARAALRRAWLRRYDGSHRQVALSRQGSLAPNPVTRAATTPSDTAPHGAAAVTGSTGPVVPIPQQRGNGATGPAHTSVTLADAPSRAIREESAPHMDSFPRDGVLAPAGKCGRTAPEGDPGQVPPHPIEERSTTPQRAWNTLSALSGEVAPRTAPEAHVVTSEPCASGASTVGGSP